MFHPRGPTFRELGRQALSSTEHGYDLLAPKFDYTPFRTPDAVVTATLALLADDPPYTVLDLCCGTGAGLRGLLEVARGPVVGLDLSRGMLAEAARQLKSEPQAARIRLVRAEVLEPPFCESFDAATCFGAFGHILARDEPRFIASIHRLLKPGGQFVFPTMIRPPFWSPGVWLARGFNLMMRLRNLLPGPPFIMYYLTFMLPRVQVQLERQGFEVEVVDSPLPRPFHSLKLVRARKT